MRAFVQKLREKDQPQWMRAQEADAARLPGRLAREARAMCPPGTDTEDGRQDKAGSVTCQQLVAQRQREGRSLLGISRPAYFAQNTRHRSLALRLPERLRPMPPKMHPHGAIDIQPSATMGRNTQTSRTDWTIISSFTRITKDARS